MIENTEQTEQTAISDAQRWGLPQEAIDDLASRLRRIWSRFRECFTGLFGDMLERFAYPDVRKRVRL